MSKAIMHLKIKSEKFPRNIEIRRIVTLERIESAPTSLDPLGQLQTIVCNISFSEEDIAQFILPKKQKK